MNDSRRIEDLLEGMERDHAAVQQVMPYLPQWLRNDLLSERFITECITIFEDLDKDKNGTLEPEELFPMVRNMADAHSMALDLDQLTSANASPRSSMTTAMALLNSMSL